MVDGYFSPIRSGVFEKVNDPGGGGGAILLSDKTITLITINYIVRVCVIEMRLQSHLLLH